MRAQFACVWSVAVAAVLLFLVLVSTAPANAQLVASPVAYFGFDLDDTDSLGNYTFDEMPSNIYIDTSTAAFGRASVHFWNGEFGLQFTSSPEFVGEPGQYINSWALSAWVYVTDTTVLNPILTYWPDSSNEFFSWGVQPTQFGFVQVLNISLCQDPTGDDCAVQQVFAYNGSISAKTWTHVAVTCISRFGGKLPQFVLYTNGTAVGTATDRAGYVYVPTQYTDNSWLVGYQGEYSAAFQGNIDELWVFSSPPGPSSQAYPVQYFNDPHAAVLAANNTMPCSPGSYVADNQVMVCDVVSAGSYSPTYGQVAPTLCSDDVLSAPGSSKPSFCNQTCLGGSSGLPTCCDDSTIVDRGFLRANLAIALSAPSGGLLPGLSVLEQYFQGTEVTFDQLVVGQSLPGTQTVGAYLSNVRQVLLASQQLLDYDASLAQSDLFNLYCFSGSNVNSK